ncbi:nucleotide exchange factor GrpE [Solirubrum puertoriconensis]|uniref:nucleotide exchange factor GrpE n=1 Tax=Solirubrum puertoriconensis TaxID=1751427 RepID=UPI000A611114|nr:nucleotide exchange factor GrpE [Solirubrum puertoriconensis]
MADAQYPHAEESQQTNGATNNADHVAGEMFDEQPTQEATDNGAPAADASRADQEIADLKDKYLRLAAEFENYKRRTTKERADLFKTANQELMMVLLPVLDDFERARQHTQNTEDASMVRESIDIIYGKLTKALQQKGLQTMETKGGDFDPELHEAITQIPAPSEDLKGKVVDEVEKGYYLGDKVIRHAKVVLGQ